MLLRFHGIGRIAFGFFCIVGGMTALLSTAPGETDETSAIAGALLLIGSFSIAIASLPQNLLPLQIDSLISNAPETTPSDANAAATNAHASPTEK